MKLRAIKHTLILAWIRQLAEESDGWLACKGVTDPKQIDAYKAGVATGQSVLRKSGRSASANISDGWSLARLS